MDNSIKTGLVGYIVWDMIGLPHEFSKPSQLKIYPVTDIDSYKAYNQPKGTWGINTS